MTDKERLESIQSIIRISTQRLRSSKNDNDTYVGEFAHVAIDDYQWLIEQAERVEKLVDVRIKDVEIVGKTREQNNRLREALKFYADKENYKYTEVSSPEILADYGEKARQALQGESHE